MKGLLTFLLIMTVSVISYGQVYQLNALTNGTTISTCSGTFYDSGGPNNNYGNNQNFTVTFCSSLPNNSIELNFAPASFAIAAGDNLCFYDGNSTAAPLIGCSSSAMPIFVVQSTATNTSGCVTVAFTSNGSVTSNGWVANVTCHPTCQTVIADLANSSPLADPITGTIDICPGATVTFGGQGNYPQNNLLYAQSDATSTFIWSIEGQQYTGQVISQTFNNPGGFRVQLDVIDANGCESNNLINQEIRVSGTPYFNGTTVLPSSICVGDTLSFIEGNVMQTPQDFAVPLTVGDSIFLPDGNGVSYTTSVTVNDFLPTQTLTNAASLFSICVNMEHSYMGDLNISIACPTGQSITLHQYPGGGGTFLGVPVDNDATPLIPGQGFDYCWSASALTTWANAAFSGPTLAPGSYAPAQSFAGLLGCALNGDWTITITDNLGSDNGFIFNWGINFDPAIYPALNPFTPVTDSTFWVSNPAILNYFGDTAIMAAPNLVGNTNFVFSTINDFGCQFDTIIGTRILPFTDLNCLDCDSIYSIVPISDTVLCQGNSVGLDATVQSNISESTFTYVSSESIVTGNTVTADLVVSGISPATVTANSIVSVCINAEHVFPGDFDLFLVAPSGQVMELSTDNGGFLPSGNAYPNTCFTPSATNLISLASAPFVGTFKPEGSFNFLNGATINGTWKLQITDDGTAGIDGILNSWSITFHQNHTINYTWTPAAGLSCTNCPNPIASPTTTTQYIVNTLDNFSCAKSDTVIINVIEPLPAPVVNCGNVTGITIEFVWAAITGAIGYQVNVNNTGWVAANGILSHNVVGLLPSQTRNIQVRAVRGNSCDNNNGIGIGSCTTLPCAQVINLDSIQTVSCFGGSDGIGYISTTNSQPPFNFKMIGGNTQATGTFTNLSPGTYQVFVKDGFNCADTVTFVITEPDTMTFTPTIVQNVCFGESNGSITVSVTGGTAPYNYAWSNGGSIINSNNNLPIGNYTLTVTDAKGCQKIKSYTITQPTDIALSIGKTNVLCFGDNTGSAFVTATGGTGAYNYTWNSTPVQNIDSAVGLPIGTYKVIVEDANGCLDSIATTINQPTPLVSTTTTTNASCFGFNDGKATVAITGGTPNYTYNWSTTPPQDSSTAINLVAGTYYVTATDGNGCTILDTAVILQPTEIQASFTSSQVTCFGLSDGSATVTATGGVGANYTYAWNTTPMQNLPTAFNIPGGYFSVTITDSTNCSVSDTVYVYAPVLLDLDTLYATPTLCFGSNEGVVGVQTSGGTGSKTYVWNTSPISSGAVQSNLFAGQYTVTATDQQGCQLIDSIIVQQPDSIQATFTTDSVNCYQGNDGSTMLAVIGGTGAYLYSWSNGQTGTQASNLPSGFAVVTITDVQNCLLIDSIFVPEPLPVTAIMSSTQVSCNGDGNGTATAIPLGGTLPYTYSWADNQVDSTALNLSGGMHYVTITDSYGCTGSDSVSVLEYAPLETNDTSTQVTCFNYGNGTATILPSGGTGTYTYQWQGLPSLTATITNLDGGWYYYTLTDSDNCTVSDSVSVFNPSPIAVTMSSTPVSCFGGLDGSATAIPSGGTLPYFYNWSSNAQNTATIYSLQTGFVYVTVTDLYNCSIIDTVFVQQPTPVTATSTFTPTLCNGSSDGTATVTPAGGVGNYTYNWIGLNQTTATATGLAAGTYYVLVADSNNCSVYDTVTVTQPPSLGILPSIAGASCYGYTNGAIGVTPVGGVGGYSYQWSTSLTDILPVNSGLGYGTYTITVTDGNGCTLVDSFLVPQPPAINHIMGSIPVSCANGTNGTAFINVSGGTQPYAFSWNPTAINSSTITGLPYGNYAVTVTDAYGCFIADTILVDEPSPIDLTMSQQAASCFGVHDGEAYVTITGGSPGYSILWNNTPNGVTDSIAYLIGNKNYIVTVTDSHGCIATDTVFVPEPEKIIAQIAITDETCFTSDNGMATAIISGGTPPFTYDWGTNANNQTTQTATNLASGVYTVLISDVNNCHGEATNVVNQPDSLQIRLIGKNIACHGDTTGSAIAVGSGGVGSYTFLWQTNSGTQVGDTAFNLNAGVFAVVTITDANGCETSNSIVLTQPNAPLYATLKADSVDCYGDENGRITLNTTEGTAPYTYRLDNNSVTTSNVFIGLEAGNYTILITDANNCTLSKQATINQPQRLTVDLGPDILLNDGEQAILEPTITNGIAPFTYVWQPADSLLSCGDCLNPVVSNILFDKRYDFIVTDANGCTGEDFMMIRTRKVKDIFVANAFTPNNDGTNDALYVQGNPYLTQIKTFRIFDRWGELVYEVTDVKPNAEAFGWDGTFKGQSMNAGVFVWYAEVEFADGDVRTYQGSTMLLR